MKQRNQNSISLVGIFIFLISTAFANLNETQNIRIYFDSKIDLEFYKRDFELKNLSKLEKREILVKELKRVANSSQSNVTQFLESNKNLYKNYSTLWGINAIEVQNAKKSLIQALKSFQEIEAISVVPKIKANSRTTFKNANQISQVSEAVSSINAPKLWNLGYLGNGRTAMILDSGVDGNNPYVSANWLGNSLSANDVGNAWYDSIGTNSTFPEDKHTNTHGTGVASVILGHSANDTIGVAPNANWISGKSTPDSQTVILNTQLGLQWAISLPDSVFDNLDVINNSYGTYGDTCAADAEFTFYDTIEMMEVSLIWEVGDNGPNPHTINDVASGAISPTNTFSVGSVDNQNSASNFSSRGPSSCADTVANLPHSLAFGIKPEVVTQGENVTVAQGAFAGGGTQTVNSTSFSTALVSGAICLLKEVNPDATPAEIKTALLNTATDLGEPGDDNTFGMGKIDVYEAAKEISPYEISGQIVDSLTSLPVQFAKVKITQTDQETTSSVGGSYSLNPLVTNISLEISAFGYQPKTITNLPILVAGTPLDTNFVLVQKPTANVGGSVLDENTFAALDAQVYAFAKDVDGEFLYETDFTNSSGFYTMSLPEGNYRIRIETEFPYPMRENKNLVVVGGVSQSFNHITNKAQIILIDDDNSSAIDTVYEAIMDSLDLIFYRWETNNGLPTILELNELNQPSSMLWYTGKEENDVLDDGTEIPLLIAYLNNGNNVILTGQNLAESEGNGTFFQTVLGIGHSGNYTTSNEVRGTNSGFLSNSSQGFLMETLGANPENQQTSMDKFSIVPNGNAQAVANYGTNGTDGIAIVKTSNNLFWRCVIAGFDLASIQETTNGVSAELVMERIFDYFYPPLPNSEESSNVVSKFKLAQNYPNPFNPTTTINYELEITNYESGKLTIFNVLGETVKEFELKNRIGSVVWNGTSFEEKPVSSGVYFYKLKAGNFSKVKKMLLLK